MDIFSVPAFKFTKGMIPKLFVEIQHELFFSFGNTVNAGHVM